MRFDPLLPKARTSITAHHLLRVLRAHLAPHLISCGIESNRWGERPRKEQNFPSAGTFWVLPADAPRDYQFSIALGILPYRGSGVMAISFNDDGRAIVQPMQGWRATLLGAHGKGLIRLPDDYHAYLLNHE